MEYIAGKLMFLYALRTVYINILKTKNYDILIILVLFIFSAISAWFDRFLDKEMLVKLVTHTRPHTDRQTHVTLLHIFIILLTYITILIGTSKIFFIL